MFTPRPGPVPEASKRWLPVLVIGLVAVTAGIALPQALPSVSTTAKSAPIIEPAGKGKLVYAPPVMPEAPDARGMLTRLGLATAGVLALCVVTLWLGKRWLGVTTGATSATSQLRFVETLALGNRCAVHLVHVGNRPVLIGSDPSGLKGIVPLPEAFFEQALGAAESAVAGESETPAQIYQRAMVDDIEPKSLAG